MIEFVREAEHQRDFDGRWQVWIGSRYFGVVRKSADPIKRAEAWGFESVPFGPYKNGQRCDAGHRTRQLAALSLVGRIEESDA